MLHVKLNDIQRHEMRLLARRTIGRVSERVHFVLLSDAGKSPPEIGALLGYDAATVRMWLKRFMDEGVAGLEDAPRSGRPSEQPHLDDIVETQAGQPPGVYGYLQTIWTVALLVLHLGQRYRVAVSASGVRRALHRIGMSWHRPKLCPARRPDPERAAKEVKLAAALADPDATVVAVDECDCHLLAIVRAMWQRVGEQLRLPTPGQNRRRSVFGALNLRTGQWHYTLTAHKRSSDFIAFLDTLLAAYTSGTLFVIADNASIHHSQALRRWLDQHPRVQMIYLPTYAGHVLNPVEKVWWQLKRFIAANRNFRTLSDLDAAIVRCLDDFSPQALLQLCNSDVVRRARLAVPENVEDSFAH
jgi:putative transposase